MIETTAGYFSFKEILEDGQKALDSKLYRIALMLALIVPSACSRVEFANDNKYRDHDGNWRDRDCYIDWCLLHGIKYIDAENKCNNVDNGQLNKGYCQNIYEIRCGVIHASEIQCDIVCNLCANIDQTVCNNVNCDKVNQYDICVVPFCRQMFEVGMECYEKHKEAFDVAKLPMKLYEF